MEVQTLFGGLVNALALALSIVAWSPVVNAAPLKKSPIQMISDAAAGQGLDARTGPELGAALGLGGDTPLKTLDLEAKRDGKDVDGLAVLVAVTSAVPQGVGDTFLFRKTVKGGESVSRYYRTGRDETLLGAWEMRSRQDAEGRAIRGSGSLTPLEASSEDVKKAFTAEMTAAKKWLKKQRASKPHKR